MIVPPFLKPGDTIGIIAPGRKVSTSDIKVAVQVFETWGLRVVLGKNIFSDAHSYMSGSDEERLSDLQSMLDDDAVRAVVCARGGYGTTRIIDDVDFFFLVTKPKWIVGFSDITALHLRFFNEGVESVHGIMPVLFSRGDAGASIESLRNVLFGGRQEIIIPANESNRHGRADGQILGGNLSLIVDSLGTKDDTDMTGKILVLEEVDEYKYKVDRMMTQLNRAGKLDDLAGLVVGHMTDIRDTELNFGESVEQIILDKVKNYNFPVAFGFPSGHEHPNIAWRHGSSMRLNVYEGGAMLSSC